MENDDKQPASDRKDSLEVLLEREITLDMDVRDFMTISGIDYVSDAYFASRRLDLQAEMRARRAHRRAEPNGKYDGRVYRFLLCRYGDGNGTMSEVKAAMKEARGWRGFGEKSKGVARLNEILTSCGLEPFRYATSAEARAQYREIERTRKETYLEEARERFEK